MGRRRFSRYGLRIAGSGGGGFGTTVDQTPTRGLGTARPRISLGPASVSRRATMLIGHRIKSRIALPCPRLQRCAASMTVSALLFGDGDVSFRRARRVHSWRSHAVERATHDGHSVSRRHRFRSECESETEIGSVAAAPIWYVGKGLCELDADYFLKRQAGDRCVDPEAAPD